LTGGDTGAGLFDGVPDERVFPFHDGVAVCAAPAGAPGIAVAMPPSIAAARSADLDRRHIVPMVRMP